MPFPLIYGELPDYDRQFIDTGILTETVSFTPDNEIKVKKKHTHNAYGVPGQVQVWPGTLAIELKGAIIPDEDGHATGLAAVYPGQAVTCLHFAAAAEGGEAISRCGYTRDPNMLLMVELPKIELGDEIPSMTNPMRYFPTVSKNPIVLAA